MREKKEVWKDIPNYKGLYQVSNIGRVKSLERIVERNYKNDSNYIIKERILRNSETPNGYYIVSLCIQFIN